jgi:hypothetical protein
MEICRTDDIRQDDARRLHRDHSAGRLFDDLIDPAEYASGLPAVLEHLPIEVQPPVAIVLVESLADLFSGLHPDPLAGLEIESLDWHPSRRAHEERVPDSALETQLLGQHPARDVLQLIEDPDKNASEHTGHRRVAVLNVIDVLANVPDRDDITNGAG